MKKEKDLFFHSSTLQGIAILSLTLLAVALVPFGGPVVIIMTPLPIIYCCVRLGRIKGLAALGTAFLAVLGIMSLLDRPVNLSVLIMIGFTGVMLSEVLKRRYSIEKTLTVASLALFFCGVGFVIYYSIRTGAEPWRLVELYVAGIIRENLELYAQLNVSADQISMIRENATQIKDFFIGIFPALAMSGALLTVWLNVLAGRFLLRRHGGDFPDFGDLASWKAPEKLVWLLIASGGMLLAPVDILNTVGVNILIVCCLIYLLQGLAIAGFLFRHKRIPVIFRWLFYFLIMIQQYMVILVIAFGLFDIWVDFRKRIGGIKDVHA